MVEHRSDSRKQINSWHPKEGCTSSHAKPEDKETLAIPGILPPRRARPKSGPGKETWLTPFAEAYQAAYGEAPPAPVIKRLARPLAELAKEHPTSEVLRRFRNYVHGTPARFYSVERFAQTWPAWADAPQPTNPTEPRAGETVDAYIARIACGG